MQIMAKVPNAIVSVIQALVIITIVASQMVLEKWNDRKLQQESGSKEEV